LNFAYDLGHLGPFDLGEIWFLWNDTAALIGNLSNSSFGWVTDTFALDSELFANVSGNSWTIAFILDENTWGQCESIWLDWSRLSSAFGLQPFPLFCPPCAIPIIHNSCRNTDMFSPNSQS